MGLKGFEVSRLHYENYIVMVEVPLVDDLLTIKEILRSFKLSSSIKWIFSKSNMFGVNVSKTFLELVYAFFSLLGMFFFILII